MEEEKLKAESFAERFPWLKYLWYSLAIIIGPLVIIKLIFVVAYAINPLAKSTISIDLVGLMYNSIVWGSLYLSLAIGLTLGYKVFKFANFAVGEYFLIGGYTAVFIGSSSFFNSTNDNPHPTVLWWGLLFAFLLTGLYAVLVDTVVFRPLRNRGASMQTMMITSLGVSLFTRGLIQVRFGTKVKPFITAQGAIKGENLTTVKSIVLNIPLYDLTAQFTRNLPNGSLASVNMRLLDFIMVVVIVGLVLLFFFLLKSTKIGKAIRATASNPDLAASSGISTTLIYVISSFFIGGIAGVGGAFYATKYTISTNDALFLLVPAFSVIVLGTVGSLIGTLVATFIVGLARSYSEPILTAIQAPTNRSNLLAYNKIVPFFVLIIVLIIHPVGIGEKMEQKFNEFTFRGLFTKFKGGSRA